MGVANLDGATTFLNRAVRLDYYRVHSICGELARLEDRDQDAVQEYNSALANLPDSPAEGAALRNSAP